MVKSRDNQGKFVETIPKGRLKSLLMQKLPTELILKKLDCHRGGFDKAVRRHGLQYLLEGRRSLAQRAKQKDTSFNQNARYEYGYILGCLLSDGCIYINKARPWAHQGNPQYTFFMKVWDKEYAEALIDCIEKVFDVRYKITEQDNGIDHYYVVTSKRKGIVFKILSEFNNIMETRTYTARLPKIVKEVRDVSIGFLAGFLDGDGWLGADGGVGFAVKEKRFVDEICDLLTYHGFNPKTYYHKGRSHFLRGKEIRSTGSYAIRLFKKESIGFISLVTPKIKRKNL